MSEPSLVLEYELTADRARAEFRHFLRARRRSWWKGVAAGSFLFVAIFFYLPYGDYLWAVIYGVVGIEYWFLILSRFIVGVRIRSSSFESKTVQFELDDRGVVRGPRLPKHSPLRFWWKALRQVSEDAESIDLVFDMDRVVSVPQDAFADEDQRVTFRNLVATHLRASHVVVAGR